MDGINCAVRIWPKRQFPQTYEKNHRLHRAVSFSLPVLSRTFSPFLFCPCHIFSLFSSYRHFFFRPDQPLSLLSGNRRFFLLYRKLSLVRHRFDRSALPFLRSFLPHFFSAAPHSSCLHHIRFPPFLFLSLPLSPLYRPSFARCYQPSSPLTSIGRFSASSALFL